MASCRVKNNTEKFGNSDKDLLKMEMIQTLTSMALGLRLVRTMKVTAIVRKQAVKLVRMWLIEAKTIDS